MKKTLIVIIAVVLVLVLSLSLFGCNKKDNQQEQNGGEQQQQQQEPNGKTLTADQLGEFKEATDLVVNYADQYIVNNATDKLDNSKNMENDIKKNLSSLGGKSISKVAVKLESDNCYSLTFTYKNKDTYTYHVAKKLQAQVANNGVAAGYGFDASGTSADFLSSMADVYNALLRTIQQAIEKGKAFGSDYELAATGKDATGTTFGGSVKGAFTLNYGEGEKAGTSMIGPVSYGLKVYGKLGYSAKDTQVAIEVIDELKELTVVGLYYIGAETAENCKLYLDLNIPQEKGANYQQKVYINNADLNTLIGNLLGGVFKGQCKHDYKNGYCTKCGAVQPEAPTSDPFYEHEPNYTSIGDAVNDLINNENVGIVMSILGTLVKSQTVSISGGTRYQYQLDLGALLDKILGNVTLRGIISGALNPVIEGVLPLDLGSFRGVGGVLNLSFDVTSDREATLAGVQVAYNVGKKDFRWSAQDEKAKVYGPVNVALTVSDFSLKEQTVRVSGNYNYFSPLNAEVSADVKVSEISDEDLIGDYKFVARSDFNPFVLLDGKAQISITKKGESGAYADFLRIEIDDGKAIQVNGKEEWDWNVLVYYAVTDSFYQTRTSQSDIFKKLGTEFFLPLVSEDSTSVVAPISDYVWELIHQFSQPYDYTADFLPAVASAKADVNKLAVPAGKEGSKWLNDTGDDSIKAKALANIDAEAATVNAKSTKAELKAAIKKIKSIASEAKSDFNAQLKLEGKNDSVMEGFNFMELAKKLGDLLDLFMKNKDADHNAEMAKYFDYVIDFEGGDYQLFADLDYNVYNKFITLLQAGIPKLQKFDRSAATVKAYVNYGEDYKGQLKVVVEYDGTTVDVYVNIKDCFEKVNVLDEETGEPKLDKDGKNVTTWKLVSTCTMSADVFVGTTDGNYVYKLVAEFKNWDKENGQINISFKESDGKNVTAASQEFAKAAIIQHWDGEDYKGFDLTLTLASRNKETNNLNPAHTYVLKGSTKNDMYYLTFDFDANSTADDILLGIGNFKHDTDKVNKLSFDIEAPYCDISFEAKMGADHVRMDFTNLKLANWGAEVEFAAALSTADKTMYTNETEENVTDAKLYEIITNILRKFAYAEVEAE